MKILHVINSLGIGGAEKLVVDLSTRMALEGHSVGVISLSSHIPFATTLHNSSIQYWELSFDGTIYSVIKLYTVSHKFKTIVDNFKPDVIHAHLFMSHFLAALWCGGSTCVFVTHHNIHEHEWIRNGSSKFIDSMRLLIEKYIILPKTSYHIAVSKAVQESVEKKLCIPAERITTIFNGVDLNKFRPNKYRVEDYKSIVQVGRFYTQKGYDISLHSFNLLLKFFSDVRLHLVGDGPLLDDMESLAVSLGISSNVEFHGAVSDVTSILADAHLFWMPSRWEGHPIACMEAMAAGLPVICSRVSGLTELVDEEGGQLVPPEDPEALAQASIRILKDDQLRNAMSNYNRLKSLSKYSINNTVHQYLRMYQMIQ